MHIFYNLVIVEVLSVVWLTPNYGLIQISISYLITMEKKVMSDSTTLWFAVLNAFVFADRVLKVPSRDEKGFSSFSLDSVDSIEPFSRRTYEQDLTVQTKIVLSQIDGIHLPHES